MTVRDILLYPDPALRREAQPVTQFDDSLRSLVEDMAETMYGARGVGLAAPQVDVLKRVLIVDISSEHNRLQTFVNPTIVAKHGSQRIEEGCLSFPGQFETVTRAATIQVAAKDVDGQDFEIDADELLAVAIQHECDHLDGRLFVDMLSPLKRRRVRKKLLQAKV